MLLMAGITTTLIRVGEHILHALPPAGTTSSHNGFSSDQIKDVRNV